MDLHSLNTDHSGEKLYSSIHNILETSRLCSIATIGSGGESHICTVYFCFSDKLRLYFLSNPETEHCRNISSVPKIAIAVFNTQQEWDSGLRGLQLFGECYLAESEEIELASTLYTHRFPAYLEWLTNLSSDERQDFSSRFYFFSPTHIKILDEDEFGEETFITAFVIGNTGI